MSQRKRVCLRVIPARLSRGIHRVADALERYAPDWAEIVEDPQRADLWVVHCIGHGSLPEKWPAESALIQYCLRTTEDARPEAWLPHWERAKAVWSYYDIAKYCRERDARWYSASFYHAPLGVDGAVFRPSLPRRTTYVIGTSGFIADTEGVIECLRAANRVGRKAFHLGPNLDIGTNMDFLNSVDDETVAEMWSQCTYVAGLRRCEGFELPALEGLACGARAVMFDAPHYREWFDGLAEFVPEVAADEVEDALTELFSRPARVVTEAERKHVLEKFDWKTLAEGFWERLR